MKNCFKFGIRYVFCFKIANSYRWQIQRLETAKNWNSKKWHAASCSRMLMKNCYNFGPMKRLISLVQSPPWLFIYTLLNYKLKIIIRDKCKTFQDKLNSKQQKNDMDGLGLKKNCYNFGLIKDLFPLIGARYKIYVSCLKKKTIKWQIVIGDKFKESL